MIRLSIQPLQWATLPDLHDTPELDESDLNCLADIKVALERHGKLRRFAVHLAHRHFELADDEILVERQNTETRSQEISVVRRGQEGEARPTTWLFHEGVELRLSDAVYCVCVSDPNKTEACIRHGKSRSPSEAHQKEEAVRQRRISEEKGNYEQGFPVAGHDGKGRGRSR